MPSSVDEDQTPNLQASNQPTIESNNKTKAEQATTIKTESTSQVRRTNALRYDSKTCKLTDDFYLHMIERCLRH